MTESSPLKELLLHIVMVAFFNILFVIFAVGVSVIEGWSMPIGGIIVISLIIWGVFLIPIITWLDDYDRAKKFGGGTK